MSSHDTVFVDREAELATLMRYWGEGGFKQPEATTRDELIDTISKSLGVKVTGRDVVEVIEGLSRVLRDSGRRAA